MMTDDVFLARECCKGGALVQRFVREQVEGHVLAVLVVLARSMLTKPTVIAAIFSDFTRPCFAILGPS